jgi:TonB-dependent receptor
MDRINTNGYSFDYRTDPKHPTLNYGFDVTNPANWYIGPLVNPGTGTIPGSTGLATGQNQGPEIRIRPITSTNKFRTGQLDLTYDLTDQIKLRAGAQFKRFSFDSVARRMATERNFPVIPAGKSVTDLTTLVNGIQHFDTSGTPTTWLVPDIRKFADIYNIYSNTGFFALQGAENASARGDIRSVVERDRNFYVQSDFKGDVFGLSLHGDVGVRFVHTAQAATGYSNVGASYSQITLKRAYDDTLPAFNIAADLTSKLVLRVSAAKVMTRPGLGSLTPGGSVSVAGGTRSVTSGNPNLDPIRAKTADIGLEWYFGAQSLLSVAGFYKDIGTYIQTLSSIQPFTASGLPTTILDGTGVSPSDSFTFSQPVNTPGGKLKGFEINYQQPLRFLPGKLSNLGVLLNYTYVTSNIKYVVNATTTTTASLVGLSKNAYNATIYYEDKKISTRVSAAYRSNYLRAVPGPFNTEFSGTKGTLNVDASLSYNLNDHFSISVDVLNITDEYDDTYVGARQLTEDYRTYGRTYMAGIRFSY